MKIMGKVTKLKEITGDIWEHAKRLDAYVVIPTNGFVKNNGECVMGAGLAKQAAEKYSDLPKRLGNSIKKSGNRIYIFEDIKILTFPVKYNWWEMADIHLIDKSARDLCEAIYTSPDDLVLLPRVGCGNGRLRWEDVKPVLQKRLKGVKNVIICNPPDVLV